MCTFRQQHKKLFATVFVIILGHVQSSSITWPANIEASGEIFGGIFRGRPSQKPVTFSTPEECMRPCIEGAPPLTCYYKMVVEYYPAYGAACDLCTPNITNQLTGRAGCECILADATEKTVFTINRMIPGPSIQVCQGDRVVIDVTNNADGLGVSFHWHGLWQKGYQYFDGVPYVTQCPIQSGDTFRYHYVVKNPGTHFYHSHVSVQMIDGQYGSLIVRAPPNKDPNSHLYDYDLHEHMIHLSDWMHVLSLDHFPGHYRENVGQEPDNYLINGKGTFTDPGTGVTRGSTEIFYVKTGKRYRFRVINGCSTVCLARMSIQGHKMKLIASDGVNIVPTELDYIIMAAGERYDIVVEANQNASTVYWIMFRALGECEPLEIQQGAMLKYVDDSVSDVEITRQPVYEHNPVGTVLNPLDATQCPIRDPSPGQYCANQLKNAEAVDSEILKPKPDIRVVLSFSFFRYNVEKLFAPGSTSPFIVAPHSNHIQSMINNITYQHAPSPLITTKPGYERICQPSSTPKDCTEPCGCTHSYHFPLNSVVELVVWDPVGIGNLYHPFHMHGYAYTVMEVGQIGPNITEKDVSKAYNRLEKRLKAGKIDRPAAKDTLIVPSTGYIIIRIKASNPGWWLFHCHFLWHTASGMDMVLHVGEKRDLPPVPRGFPKCYSWTPDPQFKDKK